MYYGLPLHCLHREFNQLAVIFQKLRKKVTSCNIAKQALGEASWNEAIIVYSRKLLEPESLRRGQEGHNYFESIGGLEVVRSVVVDFLHFFLTTF